tara:strand:+ start:18311 stop:19312 length:1002 start_codon:yes stop_codon:yes gene_type:complete
MRYYCSYPPSGDNNPFFKVLEKHLLNNNWQSKTFQLRTKNLLTNRKQVKILWFHWPNSHWRKDNLLLKFIFIFRFFYHLFLASLLGYKLVWSAHNVLPHGLNNSWLELFLRKLVVRNIDLVIGHAKNTKKMLYCKGIKPKNYVLAIHGHYEDYYNKSDQDINRKKLGFLESDIILLINNNGKNNCYASIFIDIFSKNDYDNLKLLVYGKEVSQSKNIKNINRFLKNEELSSCIQLSDFVVLPYEEITTSGTFFLALTFGKPVLAKKIDFFIDHSLPNTSVLYNNFRELVVLLKSLDIGNIYIDNKNLSIMKDNYNWSDSSIVISEKFNELIAE